MNEETLAAWILCQRWYGAKQAPAALSGLTSVALSRDAPLTLTLAEFGGSGDAYQLLLMTPGALDDALDDPVSVATLMGLFRTRAEVSGEGGTVVFEWDDRRAAPPDGPVRRLVVEQSNTSLVVGEALILKVFRHVEAGPNPEVEMLGFLTEHKFAHVPALAGWYRLVRDGSETALGVVQEYVPAAPDGWAFVLEGLTHDPGGLLAPLRNLGAVLGELHRVLGSAPDNDVFETQPAGPDMTRALSLAIATTARGLLREGEGPPVLRSLARRTEEIVAAAEALADLADGGRLIRHHGDLHLGQTLIGPRGWVVVDFEGEPARPLAERRRRQTPLRDVAGMLRSFSYAATTHERMHGGPAPGGWEDAARAAFLDGYLDAVDSTLLPATVPDTMRLLSLLELEKLLYEIGYELGNRPAWVDIPAAALVGLLDRECTW